MKKDEHGILYLFSKCTCKFVFSLPGTASHQGVSFADGEEHFFYIQKRKENQLLLYCLDDVFNVQDLIVIELKTTSWSGTICVTYSLI